MMAVRWLARWPVMSLLALVMAGCASHAPAPVGDSRPAARVEPAKAGAAGVAALPAGALLYAVKKGDTLFSIALDHGVDYRDLAAWNNLENINRIRIGQQLRVTAPGTAPASAAPDAGSAETRPIAVGGAVVARSLDGAPAGATVGAVSPAPTFAPENTAALKRAPKGGKLPYSEENLARLKAQGAVPSAVAAAPTVPTVVAAQAEKPAVEKLAPASSSPPAAPVAAGAGEGEVEWNWPIAGKVLATFNEGGAGQEASKGIDIAGKLGDPVQAAAAGKVVYVGSGLRGYGNLVIVRHNAAFLSAYAHNSRILVKEGQAVTRGQKIAELGNSDTDQPKLHFEVRQQGKPVDPLKFLPAR